MIRAVQGPPLTDSKDSQTFRTDTNDRYGSKAALGIEEPTFDDDFPRYWGCSRYRRDFGCCILVAGCHSKGRQRRGLIWETPNRDERDFPRPRTRR
jgi:hypothetical protein